MTPAPLPSDSNQQRAGNRERAAEAWRGMATDQQSVREQLWGAIAAVRDAAPRLPNDADTDDIVDAIIDSGVLFAAEQRGAEQVAQRMRELAEAWEAESQDAMDRANAARERGDRTMHAVNVRHARVLAHAALAVDVAPPTAGREGL